MDFKGLANWVKETRAAFSPVTSCPIDGFPLEATTKAGGMRCPFCGWPEKDKTSA